MYKTVNDGIDYRLKSSELKKEEEFLQKYSKKDEVSSDVGTVTVAQPARLYTTEFTNN